MQADHSCDTAATLPGTISARLTNTFPRTSKPSSPGAASSPEPTACMANALRKQVGPDIGIMVDINQGYTPAAAPPPRGVHGRCRPALDRRTSAAGGRPGLSGLCARCRPAAAGGEALGSVRAFRDFLAAGTFDILQPDLSICGGYSGFRQIWALAQAYDLPIMPHVFGTAVNFHASLQMSAVLEPRRGGAAPRTRSWSTT